MAEVSGSDASPLALGVDQRNKFNLSLAQGCVWIRQDINPDTIATPRRTRAEEVELAEAEGRFEPKGMRDRVGLLACSFCNQFARVSRPSASCTYDMLVPFPCIYSFTRMNDSGEAMTGIYGIRIWRTFRRLACTYACVCVWSVRVSVIHCIIMNPWIRTDGRTDIVFVVGACWPYQDERRTERRGSKCGHGRPCGRRDDR